MRSPVIAAGDHLTKTSPKTLQTVLTCLFLCLAGCDAEDAIAVEPQPATALDPRLKGALLPEPVRWEIPPEGGRFTAGILEIEVPSGAVSGNTQVVVRNALPAAGELDADYDYAAPVYEFEPHGLVFAKPVVAKLAVPVDLAPDEETEVYWSTAEGGFELLRSDTIAGVTSFAIEHFSKARVSRSKRWGDDGFPCGAQTGCGDSAETACEVVIPAWRYPQAAMHIQEKLGAYALVLELDRSGGDARRRTALRAYQNAHPEYEASECSDLDEYPPAVSKQGGAGADVLPIDRSDNRGAGACMKSQISKLKNGFFKLSPVDAPPVGKIPARGPLMCQPKQDAGTRERDAGSAYTMDRDASSEAALDAAVDNQTSRKVRGRGGWRHEYKNEVFATPDVACRAWLANSPWPTEVFVRVDVLDPGRSGKCIIRDADGNESGPGIVGWDALCPENTLGVWGDSLGFCECVEGMVADTAGTRCVVSSMPQVPTLMLVPRAIHPEARAQR